LCNTNLL